MFGQLVNKLIVITSTQSRSIIEPCVEHSTQGAGRKSNYSSLLSVKNTPRKCHLEKHYLIVQKDDVHRVHKTHVKL